MAARVKRAEKRMTCCLLLLLSLFFWPVNLPGVQAADSSSAEVKDPSGDEELQEGRIFRSQRSLPRKILAAPRHLLFPLKYPVKKFMIFSERVDLMTRVQDVLYFNDERTAGWFPKVSAGGKTSLALGASIFYDDMFAQSRQWRFSLAFGDGEEWAARGIAEAPEFLGPKWRPALKVWAEEKGEEDYYFNRFRQEAGNATGHADITNYDRDLFRFRLEIPYLAHEFLTVGTNLDFDIGDVEESEEGDSPIPRHVEGAYGDMMYFAGGDLYMIIDNRDSDYRATRGWYFEGRCGARTNFKGTDGQDRDLSFYFYDFEVQRFISLFAVFRSIVVRARAAGTAPFKDQGGVPFYFQPVLDENHALRGYERGRLRDRGALLFNLEYRYAIWDTWDGVLFLDEGQVYWHPEQFAWDRFHWSAGAGIRFSGGNGFIFRIQAAFSDEAHPQMVMKMDQAF